MAISTPVGIGSTFDLDTSSTDVLTTDGSVPSNSKIWLAVGWFGTGITLTSVADDGPGLTWRIDTQRVDTVGVAIVSADAPSGMSVSTDLTITLSGAAIRHFAAAAYSTGVETGASSDYSGRNQWQANVVWSSTAATVNNNDIMIGACTNTAGGTTNTNTPSGGNNELYDISDADGQSMTLMYQFGTGASIAASGTWSSGGEADGAAVNYTAAVGGDPITDAPEKIRLVQSGLRW